MMCVLKANSVITRAKSLRIAVRFALKILYFLQLSLIKEIKLLCKVKNQNV